MIRLLGAALLVGGGTALGLCAAGRLSGRVEAIEALLEGLELMERELAFHLAATAQLLERAARASPPARDFFTACRTGMGQLGEKTMADIWEEALPLAGDIGRRAQLALGALGPVLGRYDGPGQQESLAAAREELTGCLEQARKERMRLGRVYCALGAAAGAFGAIVLL